MGSHGMNKMEEDEVFLRYCCIWYEFQKESKALVACKNLHYTVEREVANVWICQRWFAKFCSGYSCIWYEHQKVSNALFASKNLCDTVEREIVNVLT